MAWRRCGRMCDVMLNPITYTEKVVSDFLRCQFTTYAFANRS